MPLTGRLRTLIADHGLETGRAGEDLVFGRTSHLPFSLMGVKRRADAAWKAENGRRLEEAPDPDAVALLERLTPA